MITIKLKKISSSHNNLRTDVVEGVCLSFPEVGESFCMLSSPLVSGSVRTIRTSKIKSIEQLKSNIYSIITQNSQYEVELLEAIN